MTACEACHQSFMQERVVFAGIREVVWVWAGKGRRDTCSMKKGEPASTETCLRLGPRLGSFYVLGTGLVSGDTRIDPANASRRVWIAYAQKTPGQETSITLKVSFLNVLHHQA